MEEPETVLLIKTQPGHRGAIEAVITQHIHYTNLIAELEPTCQCKHSSSGWAKK